MSLKSRIFAPVLLVALAGVTAAVASSDSRKGDRFVPRNDDFRASAQRAASQSSSPDCCPADLNCDGFVNGADIGLMVADWQESGSPADLNDDGTVNGADIGLLVAAWGPCSG